jgi:hypothetical protein
VDEAGWPCGTFGGRAKRQYALLRLPPWCRWGLRSSGMLRSVNCYLVTDVSRQPIGPIFKRQAVQEPLAMGQIGCLETSVSNYQLTLRNVAADRRAQVSEVFDGKSLQRHHIKDLA